MSNFKVGQIVYTPQFGINDSCEVDSKNIISGQVISSDEYITAIWAKQRKEYDGLVNESYEVVFSSTASVRDNYRDANNLTLEDCLENV